MRFATREPMDARERFRRAKAAFLEVCDLPAADRRQRLGELCAHQPELRAEVEALLAADVPGAGPPLNTIVRIALESAGGGSSGPVSIRPPHDDGEADAEPPQVDGFEIIRVLGRGGFGVVYLAKQKSPQRLVALKVVRPDAGAASIFGRFEREIRHLARVRHPGIAQIYQAGEARSGAGGRLPYFAMEYVEGPNLLDYAALQHLSTRQKLELFIRVCEAVQHAHLKGIIHRDLKPANILVSTEAATVGPKILDFGVARALEPDGDEPTYRTTGGRQPGTIAYMSPEQVTMESDSIDTRSDVYALGVVLYELLTGRLPYDLPRNDHMAARVIAERAPMPVGSFDRRFRGDIQAILNRALEKDAHRRYQSAEELADDIRRHLVHERVRARQPALLYRLGLFVTRRRVELNVICVAVVVSAWFGRQAFEARRIALEYEGVLVGWKDLTLEDIRGARKRSDLPIQTAYVQMMQGLSAENDEKLVDAERYLREAYDTYAAEFGADREETLLALSHLARVVHTQSRLDEAESLYQRLIAELERLLGREHKDVLVQRHNLAALYNDRGDKVSAERMFRELLEAQTRTLGPSHADTLTTMNSLAVALQDLDRAGEAEPLLRDVVDGREKQVGPDHQDTLTAMMNLSRLLAVTNRFDEASAMIDRVIDARTRTLGADAEPTLNAGNHRAALAYRRGRLEEAESMFRSLLARQQRLFPKDHWLNVSTSNSLLAVLVDNDKLDEARQFGTDFIEMLSASADAPADLAGAARLNFGRCLRKLREFEKAEPVLLHAHQILQEALGADSPKVRQTDRELAGLYDDWGRPDDAARWRAGDLRNE
jgi:non-specific serine/threonine protein kinase/serine/threonine-protein kinase